MGNIARLDPKPPYKGWDVSWPSLSTHTQYRGFQNDRPEHPPPPKRGVRHTENFENLISRKRLAQELNPVGRLFCQVWSPQTIRSVCGDHAHFPAKSGPKNQK